MQACRNLTSVHRSVLPAERRSGSHNHQALAFNNEIDYHTVIT